jgi:ribonuclease-3
LTRPLDGLSRALDYRFDNPDLLEAALTHRSAGSNNNERLEFLGDAVLGYVIAAWLFDRYPDASEGDLSRLRASLVKRESLAGIARGLQMGEFLRLGTGELKSGGFRRDSILADAIEAVFGAIVLDSDFDHCRATILRLFESRLEALGPVDELKDPKTRLQEYLQSRKLDLPRYTVAEVSGKAHRQHFVVECDVESLARRTAGTGSSRRRAEQEAARLMLEALSADG